MLVHDQKPVSLSMPVASPDKAAALRKFHQSKKEITSDKVTKRRKPRHSGRQVGEGAQAIAPADPQRAIFAALEAFASPRSRRARRSRVPSRPFHSVNALRELAHTFRQVPVGSGSPAHDIVGR